MYCVIMGDIICSKKIDSAERAKYMAVLKGVLHRINSFYYDWIYAPFKVIRGDAFEGVLYSQCGSLEIVLKIITDLLDKKGIRLRMSLACGELSTLSIVSDETDGPAFHMANDGLEALKADGSDHWFQVQIKTSSREDQMLKLVLKLLSDMTGRWTEKQRAIVLQMAELERIGDYAHKGQQKKVAHLLGTTEPAISKQLKAVNYELFKASLEEIESFFVKCEEEEAKKEDISSYIVFYSMAKRAMKNGENKRAREYLFKAADQVCHGSLVDASLAPFYNSLAWLFIQFYHKTRAERKDMHLLYKAEDLLYRAKGMQEGVPKSNETLMQTHMVLGSLYNEKRLYQKAVELLEEEKLLAENVFGYRHPLLKFCYEQLRDAYLGRDIRVDLSQAFLYAKMVFDYAEEEKEYNPIGYVYAVDKMVRIDALNGSRKNWVSIVQEAITFVEKYLASNSSAMQTLQELKEVAELCVMD